MGYAPHAAEGSPGALMGRCNGVDVLQFELDVAAPAHEPPEITLSLDADAVDALIAPHAYDGADEEAQGGERERGGEEEGGLEI